jgi:hypothetical protein
MRPVVVTVSALNGVSSPVVLDQYQSPFNIGLGFDVTLTGTYKVQYSFDDPFATYATDYNTNATWFDHPTMIGMTADTAGNIAFACRAVRLANTAYTDGSGKLTVLQSGIV